MGIPVLILGESGSGKSASLRNFSPDEIGVLNVAGKPLPFRKKLRTADNVSYDTIIRTVSKGNLKRYAIDDSQYLMAFDLFNRVNERGYDKFTQMAVSFYKLVRFVTERTPQDEIVYFLHHTEDREGFLKAKTIGKMLDQQLTVEGLFSIVLLCKAEKGRHYFVTNSDGTSTAKSPLEMFDFEIDNDLKMVDDKIREYYGFTAEKEQTHETE